MPAVVVDVVVVNEEVVAIVVRVETVADVVVHLGKWTGSRSSSIQE